MFRSLLRHVPRITNTNILKMSTESAAKRVKTSPKLIGTHNGHFHADEALAVYMLRLLPEYADAQLLRTRNPEALENCDIIVDVHGKYDGVKYFDHHQRGFTEVFSENFKTKLSSAGLVYKHFAPTLIAQRIGPDADAKTVDTIYNKLYKSFIEALDANDNGINAYPADIEAAFSTGGVTLGAQVGSLNPNWNEPVDQAGEDAKFLEASKLMGETFVRNLDFYCKAWLPARKFVQDALESRKQYHESGLILRFEQSIPWKDHLFTLEEEAGLKEEEKPLYVLYGEGPGKNWRIQCVPVSKDSFQSRKALPEVWRGFRDEELSEKSGIPGGVFVHASGFIGGNKTEEGAFEMAKKSLTM